MQKEYRTGYPSDVNDEEWAFVAPYLALFREDTAQREHSLRAVFNGLRYVVKTGNQWRMMPHDDSVAIRMFERSKAEVVQLLMLPRSRKAVRRLVPCRRFSFALS